LAGKLTSLTISRSVHPILSASTPLIYTTLGEEEGGEEKGGNEGEEGGGEEGEGEGEGDGE
jgi:hypothetical protein